VKILAFSTSSDILSVCISDEDSLICEHSVYLNKKHSVVLLPVIDSVLKTAGIDISDVGMFACDTGPGSFTGIRIGVSTANAMAAALEKPAVGISSLDILAYGVSDLDTATAVMIYARNDQIYSALYKERKRVGGCYAGSVREYLDMLKKETDGKILFAGDAGIVFKDLIKEMMSDRAGFSVSRSNYISAFALSQKAMETAPSEKYIVPLYLKKSSAREPSGGK
jgi:tRNA threonylcarbamoyladenosine biosynthesis protein TsaB